MQRHAFALKIKEGRVASYRQKLGKIWPEITDALDMSGLCNFSMWQADSYVFGYAESDNEFEIDEEEKEKFKTYIQYFDEDADWISTPFEDMRLMYQDFGIVRSSKEMIRHRVFMTKLVPGSEEEYRKRHKELEDARTGIDPGPDSNFSIWSAGGYIFGYDEIDTSMEREMTEDDKQATITWENRMFEIMSWITDDVDWITGEHHAHVQRIAWHE